MSTRDVLDRPAGWPDAVARYAEHPDGLVDFHLPDHPGPTSTVVVLLHGGFWRAQWDRRHTRPMAEDLARRGYVVATPEYRRTGGGGGWPETFDDVELAASSVPRLLQDLGVEAGPSVVLGHSAGGHLALWLASRNIDARRFVGLAPVADLAEAHRLDLDDGATTALLGGSPDEHPGRYRTADPMQCLAEAAPGSVRIVHGTADDLVPAELSRGVSTKFPDAVTLTELDGVDHFAVIDPVSPSWKFVLEALGR